MLLSLHCIFLSYFLLFSLDEKLCIRHLSKFYDTAVKCWKNDNEEVLECVATVLKVSKECFSKFIFLFIYLLRESVFL